MCLAILLKISLVMRVVIVMRGGFIRKNRRFSNCCDIIILWLKTRTNITNTNVLANLTSIICKNMLAFLNILRREWYLIYLIKFCVSWISALWPVVPFKIQTLRRSLIWERRLLKYGGHYSRQLFIWGWTVIQGNMVFMLFCTRHPVLIGSRSVYLTLRLPSSINIIWESNKMSGWEYISRPYKKRVI